MTTIATSDATPSVGDAINLTTAAAPANTIVGYSTANRPASPAILYYISLEAAGEDALVSPRFTPDSVDGAYTWPSVVIPAAGTWTAHLRLDATDASQANVVITAS
jgi:hypothetical protein